MTTVLAQSQSDIVEIGSLLNKKLPAYRKAYSDRTSWLMSCIAELSYLRFNPLFPDDSQRDYFLKAIKKLTGQNSKSALTKLIDLVGYDHEKETADLAANLTLLSLELVETFDSNGTQAIIVANSDFAVLAFRGTEASSIRDIRADARAIAVACPSGGNIHSGFNNAYHEVALDIQNRLDRDDLKDLPLYITGHSLGGALATVAAKKMTHPLGGIAACYTFGSPRVGDEHWITDIKAPIYRLVNAADCVTMLPPGDEIITVVGWLAQWIPYIGKPTRAFLLNKVSGYLHAGNMRYMTNCATADYSEVKLLYSVSLFRRIKGLVIKKLPWLKLLKDHSIRTYRKKLLVIASKRNA
jgi:triacylglycerol lipase